MHSTLATAFWSKTETSRLHQLVLVVAGSFLLALSAKIQIPFWPVPMTMQTFVVLMIGATCGLRLGGAMRLPEFRLNVESISHDFDVVREADELAPFCQFVWIRLPGPAARGQSPCLVCKVPPLQMMGTFSDGSCKWITSPILIAQTPSGPARGNFLLRFGTVGCVFPI